MKKEIFSLLACLILCLGMFSATSANDNADQHQTGSVVVPANISADDSVSCDRLETAVPVNDHRTNCMGAESPPLFNDCGRCHFCDVTSADSICPKEVTGHTLPAQHYRCMN